MAAVLLLAFAPNALFMEHWGAPLGKTIAQESPVVSHAEHRAGGAASAEPVTSDASGQPAHCHVGPGSCAASSGLSNAIVIAAALALTLLGGRVLLLDVQGSHVSLFDLARRLIVPPKPNLRSV